MLVCLLIHIQMPMKYKTGTDSWNLSGLLSLQKLGKKEKGTTCVLLFSALQKV